MDKLIEELDEKDTKEDNNLKGGKTEESKTFKSMN